MAEKIDRTGETRVNNNGEEMKIIRYANRNDIDVQFVKDGTIIEHRTYDAFKTGMIRNPMTPTVFGIGFMGIGEFKSKDENGKETKCYKTWKSMMERCYYHKYKEKHQTYENCTVCHEWHNFQVYAKYHNENYYEVGDEKMTLDKDILHKGNKVYSPNTCVFVPSSINTLFIKCDKVRGDLPIGVSKNGTKFRVRLSKDNERICLGTYDTVEQAFLAYKIAKEQYIKEVAEEYKDKIDPRAYEAMMNYEVDIND